MRSELVVRRLAELGLEGAMLGPVETIQVSEPPRAEGRAPAPDRDRLDRIRQESFGQVRSRTFDVAGLFLALQPGTPALWRLTSPPGQVITEISGASWVHLDAAEPRVAFFEVGPGDVCIILTNAAGLAVDGNTWETAALDWPEGRGLRSPVDAPVRDWCAGAGDPWMSSYVDAHLSQGDAWHTAVAAGTFARLTEYPRERRQALLAAHGAGRIDEEFLAPMRWAQCLSHAQATILRGQALAEMDALNQELHGLTSDEDPDETSWAEKVLEACRRRDDVESVRWALQARGEGADLRPALQALDENGTVLMAGLASVPLAVEDERLHRVLASQPEAWWARPVEGMYRS